MATKTDDDRPSRLRVAWIAADTAAMALFFGGFLLGFVGLIPFGLGFAMACLAVPILFALDIGEGRWMVREFERLLRRPTWEASSGGATQLKHDGELSVFVGEGRLLGRSSGRPSRTVVGFDESAFIALAHGPMLSRMRRSVILKGQPVEFDVQVVRGDCILEERRSGLRLRLVAGHSAHDRVMGYFGLDAGSPEVAERLVPALASAGWL